MAKTLQHRRDTTSNLASVTGAAGEIFIDTTKNTVVVMDGSTAGGYPLALEGAGGAGATGATGIIGNTGATGPQGDGATGPQGAAGATGPSGGGGGSIGDFTITGNDITAEAGSPATINTSGTTTVTENVTYNQPGNFTGGYFDSSANRIEFSSLTGSFLANWGSIANGDTISFVAGGTTRTTTVTGKALGMSIYIDVVGGFGMFATGIVSSITLTSTVVTNLSGTFTFEEDGTFVADNAIIGETMITNDIITPLALDSYGLVDSTTTGTLTVNGNLDVLDDVYVNSNKTFLGNSKYQQREALFGDSGAYYDNIGIGKEALKNAVSPATGNYSSVSYGNIAIGSRSLRAVTTGAENIGIGQDALKSITSGKFSVAVGYQSLRGWNPAASGWNTAVGTNALINISQDGGNTAIGYSAGQPLTSGFNNTFVGEDAGAYKTGGDGNIYIGYQSRASASSNSTSGDNNIVIGSQATSSTANVSNEITLGNSSIDTLRCQVTSITSLSDARDKKDVATLSAGLDFVSKLKPVSFTWNTRDGAKVDVADTGFIAQDLKQAQEETGVTIPGLVYESNPEKLEAAYGKLIPVLVKAIQDLQAEVEALKSK